MGSLVNEVKRWATEELDLPAHKLPPDSYIKTLCVGAGASIWKYVIQHIYNERNVRVMRGNLQWYKILQDKELKQVQGQDKDAQRVALLREITELQTELGHIEQKISTAEEQLAHEEHSVSRLGVQYEESRLRELMLESFRLCSAEEREAVTHHTHTISSQRHTLEQLAKKADVKLVFGEEGGTAAEPQVLRDVRELCRERVLFFKSLQESTLRPEFSPDQMKSVHHHWLSAVQDVLRLHPPNQILSALQTLANQQQMALEERTAALNVEQDVSSLGFRYDRDHLLDVSVEGGDDDLPPVHSLLQSAWDDVEQSYMHLAEVRRRAGRLQADQSALLKEIDLRMFGQEHTDSLSRSVFELEVQAVRQVAVRDSVQDQVARLQLQNREKRKALRGLHSQWQSVTDFRRLVDLRQEQIRSLIKGNSTLKTELSGLGSELKQFVQENLSPHFSRVLRATDALRNSVSQEAKLFSGVLLSALDRRLLQRERVSVNQLSLFRLSSPPLCGLRQSLCAPLYMAPEELFSQTVSQRLQLCFLRRLLQLHSDSLTDVQRRTARLPAANQQALLQCVRAEDAELSQTLLPRVQELTLRCTKGLTLANHANTAITHWWEQPAQFSLPELQQDGLTFQQWLQRWKLTTRGL